jgi:chemotaxis methyl-accepting protein methylase
MRAKVIGFLQGKHNRRLNNIEAMVSNLCTTRSYAFSKPDVFHAMRQEISNNLLRLKS